MPEQNSTLTQNRTLTNIFLCIVAGGATLLVAPVVKQAHATYAIQKTEYTLAKACKDKMSKKETCNDNETTALANVRAAEKKSAHLWVFTRGL